MKVDFLANSDIWDEVTVFSFVGNIDDVFALKGNLIAVWIENLLNVLTQRNVSTK